MPATYLYEASLVIPSIYRDTYSSLVMHNLVGFFLLFNLVGNFIGLWLTDTSTRFVVLPSVIKNSRWKFCASCESVRPPRSWHCNICNICILKREHHCMFVGYCVGHRNHRYFCLFLFYMWLSVIYCSYSNTTFLVPQLSGASWSQILRFIFPMVMLITGLDASWLQVYIFFWSVHFASIAHHSPLAYHVNLVFKGKTTYENNNSIGLYNLGLKQNLLEVFGKNWRKAILWPMAPSPLPHNGIDWDTTETWRLEGPKNRWGLEMASLVQLSEAIESGKIRFSGDVNQLLSTTSMVAFPTSTIKIPQIGCYEDPAEPITPNT